MSQRAKKTGPLTDSEIMGALKHSGFPLEIRLLQAFDSAGFGAVIGHRFVPGEGEASAEVDIMAEATAPLANNKGLVHLKAMIEAKQLDERKAFVGFRGKQPEPHEMRSKRIRLSGRPTCQVLAGAPSQQQLVQLMLGPPGPLADALDPLNEPVVCRRWAEVQDHDKYGVMAKQDDTHRDSFLKLLRVTTWLEENTADFLSKNIGSPPLLRMQILLPTIVVGTPHLCVFDALTGTLERRTSFILDETHEAGGKVHSRYVDVVAEEGLPELMGRYRRAVDLLRAACDQHVDALLKIAHDQSQAHQYEVLGELNRGSRGRRSNRIL